MRQENTKTEADNGRAVALLPIAVFLVIFLGIA